jgi:hypothetical protein
VRQSRVPRSWHVDLFNIDVTIRGDLGTAAPNRAAKFGGMVYIANHEHRQRITPTPNAFVTSTQESVSAMMCHVGITGRNGGSARDATTVQILGPSESTAHGNARS